MNQGLSVLILSHNRFVSLSQTLHSLALSSQLPDEVLIADSSVVQIKKAQIQDLLGSKDISVKIFHTSPSIPHKRNILLKNAKHNLCLFIDDDVTIRKTSIESAQKIVSQHQDAAILSGICYPTNNKNLVSKYSFMLFYGQYLNQKKQLINTDFCPTMLCLIQKKIFLKNNLWFDESFLALEDIELCFRLKKMGGKILVSTDVLGDHQYRETYLSFYRSFFSYFLFAWPLFQKSQIDLFQVSEIKCESLFLLTKSFLQRAFRTQITNHSNLGVYVLSFIHQLALYRAVLESRRGGD